jgi:hypothetical protein
LNRKKHEGRGNFRAEKTVLGFVSTAAYALEFPVDFVNSVYLITAQRIEGRILAAQDDPPPNFASSILVQVHKEAASFIELADATSTTVRRGDAPGGTSIFSLYSQFIDLYERYELFMSAETRPLALDKVRSVAMAKEYFDTKTFLEAATYLQITTMEEQLKSCLSAKRR